MLGVDAEHVNVDHGLRQRSDAVIEVIECHGIVRASSFGAQLRRTGAFSVSSTTASGAEESRTEQV
jgi:hypothetical protein